MHENNMYMYSHIVATVTWTTLPTFTAGTGQLDNTQLTINCSKKHITLPKAMQQQRHMWQSMAAAGSHPGLSVCAVK
jgi:hypothetical protein